MAREKSARTYLFLVKRGTPINERFLEQKNDGKLGGMNVSGATLQPRFRCWEQDGAFLQNFILDKEMVAGDSSPGQSGYVSGYVPAFATPIALLHCEVVLVDTAVNDPNTPSTKKEIAMEGMRWDAVVSAGEGA